MNKNKSYDGEFVKPNSLKLL